MSGIVGSNLGRGSGVVGAAAVGAVSGASLTALPDPLPAVSGTNLTALNATNLGSGTASVARGGTGAATHTATNVLIGNGTSAITSIAPGADGQVLTSTGSAWQSEAAASGGKVLQVVSTNITTRPSTTDYDTSGTGGDLGLNVAITPTNSSSKFLINVSIGIGTSTGMAWGNGAWGIILVRDSTRIGAGVDVSNRNGIFMRSPSYSGDGNFGYTISFTYYNTTSGTGGSEITFRANGISQETGTLYLNRSYTNEDDTGVYSSYTSSSITVTEIDA